MKKLSLIMAVLMAIGLFAGCAQQENAELPPRNISISLPTK